MTHLAPHTAEQWLATVNRRLSRLERRPLLQLPKPSSPAFTGAVAYGNFPVTSADASVPTVYATLRFVAAAGGLYRLSFRMNVQNDTAGGVVVARLRMEWGVDDAANAGNASTEVLTSASHGAAYAGQDITLSDWCLLLNDQPSSVWISLALTVAPNPSVPSSVSVRGYRDEPMGLNPPPSGGATMLVESLGLDVSSSGAVLVGG
jgi:hypothetical protein